MATLVISDLHLGSRLGRDVLRRPEALEALLAALDGVERLVLLGDVVELLEGRPREAMDVAEPVLRALGVRLGSAAEVIVVPGNHDAGFVRPWLRARDGALGVDISHPARRDARAGPVDVVARARAGARELPRRLARRSRLGHARALPRSPPAARGVAYGVARGLLGRLPRDGATPADYEGGPSATRVEALLTRWLPRPLAELMDELAELLRAATMPGSPRRVLGRRLAPFAQRALGAQMRRASIPALARVVHRLGVDADWSCSGTSIAAGRWPATSCASGAGLGACRGSPTPAPGSTSRCSCMA